jgi:hypothetical protein
MTNSLLERLYGGLWGGAIGQAIGRAVALDKSIDDHHHHPDWLRVQQLLLWEQSITPEDLDPDLGAVLTGVLEADRRSGGDWTIALPWAISRSPIPSVTGLWLGTTLGIKGGSRTIPIEHRIAHRDLGIQLRSQAEVMVRSSRGIGAPTIPILG